MRTLRAGLVGAGFIGPWHVDAIRRLGHVEIAALAGSDLPRAQARARELAIPQAYADWRSLVEDPRIDVVHIATPNRLHYPIALAAIANGKHVVCDKPLADTVEQARELLAAARAAGVFHAVTFNYRGNPLVQQARAAIAAGQIGKPHLVHGQYLQDWLLHDSDWSWRLEPDQPGASLALADIGSHWCDLAEHVAGLRIAQVLADPVTVVPRRRKPAHSTGSFTAAGAGDDAQWVEMASEDMATVLLRFDNGARGSLTVGQVCAGHKNDLVLEICAAAGSMKWRQEAQNELWIGHRDRANELLQKDPGLLLPEARPYARLPGGHQESWSDAFCNLMRDIYASIAGWPDTGAALPPTVATFHDALRVQCTIDAMLDSAARGGVWTSVAAFPDP
ncbi:MULTISPECIES: Gfo/Idh/MocA family oxidoreductase [unclassified Lysobacter]|uniref:Gfo/Idh/MocA family protein n=1 Tax=unclassified Lysobacter TaxID=2635362 RepID=UPI001BE95C33|nr:MULTISPECIES: Gfo/Idh/MocA family oxidoreductase [unclassified Lysobacter]MBT2744922.1 Gfo/Idh/MocA family oxidoreductase [Lysobacter sp. ISL-42]MBT2752085.1 Gfo/Idh/MocA family oxidoreductase [Lysobacter sp. ISL-50]MBT2778582.1 Gfo/Idh/MocA family oxidoreductase [Lysobacter sp. ISL-54]MBT2780487.1 Gfo/Idh/MocA family oxidoreductase [Lysobacter sp. ISL-52]